MGHGLYVDTKEAPSTINATVLFCSLLARPHIVIKIAAAKLQRRGNSLPLFSCHAQIKMIAARREPARKLFFLGSLVIQAISIILQLMFVDPLNPLTTSETAMSALDRRGPFDPFGTTAHKHYIAILLVQYINIYCRPKLLMFW